MCCLVVFAYICFFFFKQKTAYEMRISDWSSDVCSSDLQGGDAIIVLAIAEEREFRSDPRLDEFSFGVADFEHLEIAEHRIADHEILLGITPFTIERQRA